METSQARPLAYHLAKELDRNDLGEVSGGGGPQICMQSTLYPSGTSASIDAKLDFRVD